MQFCTTAATSAGRRSSSTSSRTARRPARALLRRPGARPDAPRGGRPRARRPARRRLDRLDGLRRHRLLRPPTASATCAVLERSVTVDIATQLHRPTGHAINPVPLTEAERIPDAAEILEVHADRTRARARGPRRAPRRSTGRWSSAAPPRRPSTRSRSATARCARSTRGVDVRDPERLLLALRRGTPPRSRAGELGARDLEDGVVAPSVADRAGHAAAARRRPRRARHARGPRRRPRRARQGAPAGRRDVILLPDSCHAAQVARRRRRGRRRGRRRHLQRRRAHARPRAVARSATDAPSSSAACSTRTTAARCRSTPAPASRARHRLPRRRGRGRRVPPGVEQQAFRAAPSTSSEIGSPAAAMTSAPTIVA